MERVKAAVGSSVLLLMASAYMPLRVYLSNLDKFPHPERIGLIVMIIFLLGSAFRWLAFRITGQRLASVAAAACFALLVGSGGTLASRFPSVIPLAVAGGLSLGIGGVVSRFEKDGQRIACLLLGALVLSGPLVAVLSGSPQDDGLEAVNPVTTPLPAELIETPDIYLVVMDAFPGESALRDVYGEEIQWTDASAIHRFDAWSNYPVTLGSVSAVLEMGPLLEHGAILDPGTRERLAEVIAGDNRLIRTLVDAGYTTHLVESGWSRSYCGEAIDVCVPSAFIDEGVFEVLRQSIFARLVTNRYGSGMTEGALAAVDWLLEEVPNLAQNDRPDFVFASVVLPHPPLMLDEMCMLRPDGWRAGNSLYVWEGVIDQRRAAFIDQTKCAARLETRLLASIPEGSLAIIMSDHGGDSRGQLSRIGHTWSDDDIVERMNVHLAIKSPHACPLEEPIFISSVLWNHLWCFSGSSPGTQIQPRVFIADRIAEPKILRLNELSADRLRAIGVFDQAGG